MTNDLADHIEMVHERELAPGTTGLREMHRQMHRNADHWDHTHRADGTTVWKENA